MLGKLIKHELVATGRLLLPLHGILLVISVIGWLLLNLRVFDQHVGMGLMMLIVYILFIFSIAVATDIYLAVRFYKNLFSDEGYLSFTLPVKPYIHLWSKGITMTIWMLINVIMTVVSSCILMLYQNVLGEFISELGVLDWGMLENVGLSGLGIATFVLMYVVVTIFFSVTTITVSICIGQLANSHKAAASIVTFFVIQVCYQVIGSIVASFTMMDSIFKMSADTLDEDINTTIESAKMIVDMYADMFLVVLIMTAILSVIFYIVSHYIVCKRVNLQ